MAKCGFTGKVQYATKRDAEGKKGGKVSRCGNCRMWHRDDDKPANRGRNARRAR